MPNRPNGNMVGREGFEPPLLPLRNGFTVRRRTTVSAAFLNFMVLTLGFEPSLADPQSAVLTNNTKLGWCYLSDSN